VVEAFEAVLITLVDAVNAQETGAIIGGWGAPLADGDVHRSGLRPGLAHVAVARALAQVVQMSHGDGGQPLVALIAEALIGPFHELLGSWTGQGAVEAVSVRQPPHIGLGVGACEAGARAAVALDQRGGRLRTGHQAGQLLARIAAHVHQKAQHQALVGWPQAGVAQAAYGACNELVALLG
jgi:hypothetical protein